MSTQIECPGCGAKHRVVERMMGRTLSCPRCEEKIQIPSKEELDASLSETAEFVSSGDEPLAVEAVEIEREGEAIPDRPTLIDGIIIGDVEESAADKYADVIEAEPVGSGVPDHHQHHLPAAVTGGSEDDIDPAPLPRKKRDDGELDMTPMVDVTFLLLIFFMVTASFSLQKSIAMPRSQSDQPSTTNVEPEEDDLETVTVEIDEFNGFLIISNEFEREVASKLAVTAALKEAFNASAGGMRLAIVCHEKAKLQSLVDVMDSGSLANYGELQITEVEELD